MKYSFELNGKDVIVNHPSAPEGKVLPGWSWHAGAVRQLLSETDLLRVKLDAIEQTIGDLCPVCGWRMVLARGCEKCERDKLSKLMDDIVERDMKISAALSTIDAAAVRTAGVIESQAAAIAERDARIAKLKAEGDRLFLAQGGNLDTLLSVKLRAERAEAELARLRGQEPVAIVRGTVVEWVGNPAAAGTKLYAEPKPAKEAK